MGAFFEPAGRQRFAPTRHATGPWSDRFLHAGPPTALLARAAREVCGIPAARLGRICVEILAPVPMAAVEVRARLARPGARISLVEADLLVADRAVMASRSWFIRQADGVPIPSTPTAPAPPAGVPQAVPAAWGGYVDAMQWSWVSGGFEQPGPACVWARPLVDLVAGTDNTPTERLLTLADAASGISAMARPDQLTFVNTDLTVHLLRQPQGDRFWMQASTLLHPNGSGIANGILGDPAGSLATTGQLLFVQPRTAPPAATP